MEDKQLPPLWEHQSKAVRLCHPRDWFALFFEMGTGKTRTAIEIAMTKFQLHSDLIPTIVFCPLVVVPNWRREWLEFSRVPSQFVVMLKGSQADRLEALAEAPKNSILITNYESLVVMPKLFIALKEWNPKQIIFDESHRLKSAKAKRTKNAIALASQATYRWLLSGTPVLNSPMDLFSQYLAMDNGESFGKNFYAFRAKYFYDANSNMPSHIKFPDWQMKPKAIEKINQIVQETSMRVMKDECLDLPPLVKVVRHCEMTPDQQRMYRQMHKDFITYLKDKACVAQLALTKALRLQQIVSGFCKMEDGTEVSLSATPREDALKELLEELTPNHKVIVWAVFRHNYKQIRKILDDLKLGYVEVHGDVSEKDKQTAIERFTTDDTVRVYLGHTGSGGIGVNLTVCDYSIYFSRDFSLEHDLQSEARNHRGGSERFKKITRIDLVTPDTIDEVVLDKLAKKEELGNTLISEFRGGGA